MVDAQIKARCADEQREAWVFLVKYNLLQKSISEYSGHNQKTQRKTRQGEAGRAQRRYLTNTLVYMQSNKIGLNKSTLY
uniref:Transposase n=1 Tax=Ascaris lumbricoides TaxID=6252 RepID=A0A0M3HVP2_ASCLU